MKCIFMFHIIMFHSYEMLHVYHDETVAFIAIQYPAQTYVNVDSPVKVLVLINKH